MEALIQPVLHDADARPELTARNATLWACRAGAPRLRDAARGLLRALDRRELRAVLAHNRRHGFDSHFNHMRSYVLGDETALLMAS